MVYPLGEWLDQQDARRHKQEAHELRVQVRVLRSILKDLWERGVVPPPIDAEVQRVIDLSA